jgi:hypothetical protein
VEKLHKLSHLLAAARAVSPDCEVRFRGTGNENEWVCIVGVSAATIYESKPGTLEIIMDLATDKLKSVSQKMLFALKSENPEDSENFVG